MATANYLLLLPEIRGKTLEEVLPLFDRSHSRSMDYLLAKTELEEHTCAL